MKRVLIKFGHTQVDGLNKVTVIYYEPDRLKNWKNFDFMIEENYKEPHKIKGYKYGLFIDINTRDLVWKKRPIDPEDSVWENDISIGKAKVIPKNL